MGEAEDMTEVIKEKVMSEKSNIERDDLAAGNRLTKVRFDIDMNANFWGQTEERGFAESRAGFSRPGISLTN